MATPGQADAVHSVRRRARRRISCKAIGSAASAQVVACALAVAEARFRLRREGYQVVNLAATNSVSLPALSLAGPGQIGSAVFCVASTQKLVYNSNPAKLTSASVLKAAISLAEAQLDRCLVSNAMGSNSVVLRDICNGVLGRQALDPVWSAWTLIVYLTGHPRGREILRGSGLTDVDVQAAVAFERYGSEEIRRRARQRREHRQDPFSEEEESVLVTGKRKRAVKGGSAHGLSDCHAMLVFWHEALQSEDASVLCTLAAHSKATVRQAAISTLSRQAEGTSVADNTVLQGLSMNNALKSAQALVPFVGRKPGDIPSIAVASCRSLETGKFGYAVGFQRVPGEAAATTLHACALAPADARPPRSVGIAVCWSLASQKLFPTTKTGTAMPGVLERYAEIRSMHSCEAARGKHRRLGGKAAKEEAVMRAFIEKETQLPMDSACAGTTRSFISMVTHSCMNYTHESAASSLVSEAKAQVGRHEGLEQSRYPVLVSCSQNEAARVEPIPTPCPPLVLGIGANEALRRWMMGKTRKGDPCMKSLGATAPSELAKEVPGISSSEPLPLLTIADFELERAEPARHTSSTTRSAKVLLGLHVCGDCAVRFPEALACVRKTASSQAQFTMQARAAILAASSQASLVGGSLAGPLTAGYANCAIASSKKITLPDVNKIFFLSAFDAYAAGLNNLQRSCDGTPYSGTYGSRICTGFTPSGIAAHNYRSDRRQHGAPPAQPPVASARRPRPARAGNCALSKAVASELAVQHAEEQFVVFKREGKAVFTEVPLCARGIPHGYTPGIHSMTRDYCAFLESLREATGRADADTVDSIHVLPFSPFSQALRPDLETSSDASLRTCFREEAESSVATGRAHLVDATSEDAAIAKEPLFRRPSQCSAGDNPFCTAYENVDSFFNAANALALVARTAAGPEITPSECVSHLHFIVSKLLFGQEDYSQNRDEYESEAALVDASWAADALLLLNTMYPSSVLVGSHAIDAGVAKAVPHVQRLLAANRKAVLLERALTKCEMEGLRRFWAAFCREDPIRCAWTNGVAPMLALILAHNGSHNTSLEVIAQFRSALDAAARAAWLVHSPDGVARPPAASPLHDAASPAAVATHHLNPVFVEDHFDGLKQRSSVIGLKPHSYRQVLSLSMGAHIDGVECQVALNEGGLSLRLSSDATILDSRGKERTSKACSPVQTEGDEAAFGTREEKIEGSKLQKTAYDVNAILIAPLCRAVDPPRPPSQAARGEFGYSDFFREEQCDMLANGQVGLAQSASAARDMESSSDPAVARLVNSLL
tara:strand:- start:1143 stop:5012 length:3870 start_codon:yes stop_codon:yes gene_type:complete